MVQPPLAAPRAPSRRALPFALLVAVALLLLGAATAHAAPVVTIAPDPSATTDGTAPFDSASGPGQDASATDGDVRTYDTATFGWTINVNSSVGATESYDKLTFTQTLPAALRWDAGNIPLYCKGAGWGISPDGLTLTCVYVPSSATAHTGQTLNFVLTATAREVADSTAAAPAADSTSAQLTYDGSSTSPTATSTAPTLTVRAAPYLDVYKNGPTGTIAPGGYYITYTIGIRVPQSRFSTYGLRGFERPDLPLSFADDYTNISPNAAFVSCSGADLSCVDNPVIRGVSIQFDAFTAGLPTASNSNIKTASIKFFVPSSDVISGSLMTHNTVYNLVASAEGGLVTVDDAVTTNNTADYNLITEGGAGNGSLSKRFLDGDGSVLPTQAVYYDGNGQARTGQHVLSELSISNTSQTAPVPVPAVCDVWDATQLQLSNGGPGPAAHGGKPIWADAIPGGWSEGIDYVIEYGTQAPATGDDAARWSELRSRTACDDASDTWTTTAPTDLSTVTKVRIRFLNDMVAAAAQVRFRINLKVIGTHSGDLAANFLGRKWGTSAWSASDYQPATHTNWGRGDRIRINGVTVSISKRASDPSVSAGTPAVILSGGKVQFELKPRVTAESIDGDTPTATDVVIRDRLPLGLTWDQSQATTPADVTPALSSDSSGRQILTWHIASMAKGAEPTLTYWVASATTSLGNLVNDAIIASAEDFGSMTDYPASNVTDQHVSHQTVTLQSPGGVQISKSALQTTVEPGDEIGFRITYANMRPSAINDIDIIDVLPFDGDDASLGGSAPGRTPKTERHGTLGVRSVDVVAGETIKYTDADPAALIQTTNPNTTNNADYGVLPSDKAWCVEADFGTTGCPASLDDVTAVRIARASLASGANSSVTLTLAPKDNHGGDVYSNTSAIRYGAGNLGAVSNVATTNVVASRIGDLMWNDADQDGVQGADEAPLADLPVQLKGTNKHGETVALTTRTDDDGKYLFDNLVSGSYVVTFGTDGLPDGTVFTKQHAAAATAATDSDADRSTGRSDTVVLPDPSPTGHDGENLTVDAGVVLGVPKADDPPVVDTPRPTPPAAKPVDPTPTPTPAPAKPAVKGTPKLGITSTPSVKTVKAGGKVTYTIVVKNTGTAAAQNTVVCTTPAKGLTVTKVPKGATLKNGKVCWKVGALKAGGHKTLKVTLRATASAHGAAIRNVASVSASGVKSRSAKPKVAVKRTKPKATRGAGVTG